MNEQTKLESRRKEIRIINAFHVQDHISLIDDETDSLILDGRKFKAEFGKYHVKLTGARGGKSTLRYASGSGVYVRDTVTSTSFVSEYYELRNGSLIRIYK